VDRRASNWLVTLEYSTNYAKRLYANIESILHISAVKEVRKVHEGVSSTKSEMVLRLTNLRGFFSKIARSMLLFALPDSVFLTIRYVFKQRRMPSLSRPAVFTEKVLCKMLYDKNELLHTISDKLAVRDFVTERVDPSLLSQIYDVYDSETELELEKLPDKFVLKANHGSSFNYFVESRADKNPEVILPLARNWLRTNFGKRRAEWAYKSIRPKLFAEEYLESDEGAPTEYKFFCFDGNPRILKVIIGLRHGGTSRFFDLNWNTLDVAENQQNFPQGTVARPVTLDQMIEVSEQLSQGFDFLRVDLYNVGERVVFGELTSYHNNAAPRFYPREYDRELGAYWNRDSMTYLPGR